MAQPLQIDTLAFSKSLKEAGADEKLAEAIVEGISKVDTSELATKSDLKDLETSIRSDMKDMDASLRGEIAGIRGEISGIRGEMKLMEQRMTIKLGGMMLAGVGILITFDRLFA